MTTQDIQAIERALEAAYAKESVASGRYCQCIENSKRAQVAEAKLAKAVELLKEGKGVLEVEGFDDLVAQVDAFLKTLEEEK